MQTRGQNQKMIDLKTYLKYQNNADLYSQHIDEIREYNKALIEKYPWLKIKDYNDFDPYPEEEINEDQEYNFTWLDEMPMGWRLAFSAQMCAELQQELERINFVDKYVVTQVKEKFGGLRWYTCGVPADSKLYDIVDKYEDLSFKYCMGCGKPVSWALDDPYWIYYYCDECKEKLEKEAGMAFKHL